MKHHNHAQVYKPDPVEPPMWAVWSGALAIFLCVYMFTIILFSL